MVSEKLKKIIFKKLSIDLQEFKVIQYNGSIWVIDSKNIKWIFEYFPENKKLFWKYDFFNNFFDLFSLEMDKFEPLLLEWFQNNIKCTIEHTVGLDMTWDFLIGDVLNCVVKEIGYLRGEQETTVREVIGCKSTKKDKTYQPIRDILDSNEKKIKLFS